MTRDLTKPEHVADELIDAVHDIRALSCRLIDARKHAPALAGLSDALALLAAAANKTQRMAEAQERSLPVTA